MPTPHIDHNQSNGLYINYEPRILVVEDNSVNRLLVSKILSILGCNVKIACNGSEAVKAARDEEFDLIFMDIQMPVMDGYKATSEIRELQKKGKIKKPLPIIALTAYGLKADRDNCFSAGMDDYLSKPFNQTGITEVLNKWLLSDT